jgi:predicted RNA-binding protein with PIN domain
VVRPRTCRRADDRRGRIGVVTDEERVTEEVRVADTERVTDEGATDGGGTDGGGTDEGATDEGVVDASGAAALPDNVADAVLVPALELAVVVARVSSQMRPPHPVPKGLRSLTRFTKLPSSARPVVRKVLDDDPEFRARVAAAADQIEIPRASSLYLHRPDGWVGELATLAEAASDADAAADAGRAERALQRRLAGAEERITRRDEAVLAARAEASRATDDLTAERRARRQAEERLEGLARRLASLEAERDSARRRADEQAARAEDLERRLSDATTGRQEADAERALELDAARVARAAAEARADAATGRIDVLSAAVADATSATEGLTEALGRALDALGWGPAPTSAEAAVLPTGVGRGVTLPRALRGRVRAVPLRQPRRLPPAVFDDSAEAAAFLVRVPGMLVLVDGYNVTLSTWSDLPIATQRVRLIDACAELAARSAAEVLIVFDGAEEPGDLPPLPGRPRVRWRFSPPGVEADDVLLGLVADLDQSRPVTVASSDRRVRDGARDLGANAISTPQLVSALRREQP